MVVGEFSVIDGGVARWMGGDFNPCCSVLQCCKRLFGKNVAIMTYSRQCREFAVDNSKPLCHERGSRLLIEPVCVFCRLVVVNSSVAVLVFDARDYTFNDIFFAGFSQPTFTVSSGRIMHGLGSAREGPRPALESHWLKCFPDDIARHDRLIYQIQ